MTKDYVLSRPTRAPIGPNPASELRFRLLGRVEGRGEGKSRPEQPGILRLVAHRRDVGAEGVRRRGRPAPRRSPRGQARGDARDERRLNSSAHRSGRSVRGRRGGHGIHIIDEFGKTCTIVSVEQKMALGSLRAWTRPDGKQDEHSPDRRLRLRRLRFRPARPSGVLTKPRLVFRRTRSQAFEIAQNTGGYGAGIDVRTHAERMSNDAEQAPNRVRTAPNGVLLQSGCGTHVLMT